MCPLEDRSECGVSQQYTDQSKVQQSTFHDAQTGALGLVAGHVVTGLHELKEWDQTQIQKSYDSASSQSTASRLC